jgi:hypothetical protein
LEVFALFSTYECIETNGSSLAFWAAVLTQSQFRSSNEEHVNVWKYLMHTVHHANSDC